MLRPGPSGSSTHSVRQPSGTSQPASSSATRSCSTPPEGESMSTSCCSLSQNVSITRATIAPARNRRQKPYRSSRQGSASLW